MTPLRFIVTNTVVVGLLTAACARSGKSSRTAAPPPRGIYALLIQGVPKCAYTVVEEMEAPGYTPDHATYELRKVATLKGDAVMAVATWPRNVAAPSQGSIAHGTVIRFNDPQCRS